jgi:hypothetical protein
MLGGVGLGDAVAVKFRHLSVVALWVKYIALTPVALFHQIEP